MSYHVDTARKEINLATMLKTILPSLTRTVNHFKNTPAYEKLTTKI